MKQFIRNFILMCAMVSVQHTVEADNWSSDARIDALRDSILSHVTGARISSRSVSVLEYGARPDGQKDCLPAIRSAIRAAAQEGEGRIVFPAGVYYLRGPIVLESNVTLHLDSGAVLRFDPTPSLYPLVKSSWEGTFLSNYSPMIYGYRLRNVAITGQGTIDGNAMATFSTWRPLQATDRALSREMNHKETPESERVFGPGHFLRPHLIQLYECEAITLEGVKITNSPFWCIHLLKSQNVICRGLRYDAKLVNNDGIDPECSRNILIEDIHFDNGDDNVAIKSGRDNDGWRAAAPSENIVIRRCHFKGLHAVVIGSEMSSGVRNVIIEDCDYSGYCKRGIFIKTNPDRGGFVRNIFVRRCEFGNVEDLFYITSRYAGEGQNSHHFTDVDHIGVNGLKCKHASKMAIVLQGTSQKPLRDISLRNITVSSAPAGINYENVESISMGECAIGGAAGTPTQASEQDKLFERKQ